MFRWKLVVITFSILGLFSNSAVAGMMKLNNQEASFSFAGQHDVNYCVGINNDCQPFEPKTLKIHKTIWNGSYDWSSKWAGDRDDVFTLMPVHSWSKPFAWSGLHKGKFKKHKHRKKWGNHHGHHMSPVPIPSAVWLFISGLIGLMFVPRLKNR